MFHNEHAFQGNTEKAEKRTMIVMIMTGSMMIIEIIAGSIFKSMALLADGWHMGTHMTAFLIAVIAYYYARKYRSNPRFSFGTGKIGVLGGFSSSLLLIVVAVVIIYESIQRLLNPANIRFTEALIVAIIGLIVNLISASLLKDEHSHSGHDHLHDKNLRAAYLHVVADAFTSVMAIIALLCGLFLNIKWIDSLMGFVGSIVILIWAYGILKDTIVVLVDYIPKSCDLIEEIKKAIETDEETKIIDLHIWQVAAEKYAAIISIYAKNPKKVEEYFKVVNIHEELVHVSIEVIENSPTTASTL